MNGGRVVAAGTPAELTAGGGDTLSFDATPGLDLTGLATVLPDRISVERRTLEDVFLELTGKELRA
jgi:ABC-2 type transport system ATP-binding protein